MCFQMVVNNTKPNNRVHGCMLVFDSIAFHSHVTGVSNFFLRTDDDLLAKPLMCQNNSNKLDIDMKTSYGII